MTSTESTSAVPATAPPAADSRVLALAHYAARGVLEHFLAERGVTFPQHVALRAAATATAPLTPDALVAQVRDYLKAAPDTLRAALDGLLAKGLLAEDGPHLAPTDAGRALLADVGAATAPVSARIWAGIPTDALATVGRVLTLITERADAEPAALGE